MVGDVQLVYIPVRHPRHRSLKVVNAVWEDRCDSSGPLPTWVQRIGVQSDEEGDNTWLVGRDNIYQTTLSRYPEPENHIPPCSEASISLLSSCTPY